MALLIKSIAFLLSLLPNKVFLVMGRGLGTIIYFLGFRKRIAIENLQRVFPEKNSEELKKILYKNYQHYGILLLEFLRSFYKYENFIQNYCTVEGENNLRDALALGKGVFVFTAHQGNWEVLPAQGAYGLKVPVTMVTKRLKPAWFHTLVETSRARLGVHMAYEPRTMSIVMRALKNKGVVGFVMDQYLGAPLGARLPFFGIPVGSNIAVGILAVRTGAPVVPAYTFRKPDGTYRICFEAPLQIAVPTGADPVLVYTAAYLKRVEDWIRQMPEQWLWIHRRWKGDLSPLPTNSIGEYLK